jgi:hypothetical protein
MNAMQTVAYSSVFQAVCEFSSLQYQHSSPSQTCTSKKKRKRDKKKKDEDRGYLRGIGGREKLSLCLIN